MNHLLRAHAPISDANWKLLDDEARERLEPALAARKLVEFSGPHGWQHSALNLGRVDKVKSAPCDGVTALSRRVRPLVELRAEFAISRAELRDQDRGAPDADLTPLDTAARQIAVAENTGVFHGWRDASIEGIAQATPHRLKLGSAPDKYPRLVAGGVERLLDSGISGPYALALGGDQYQRVVQTAEHGGYPLLEHLRKIIEGPIVWAPGVSGAVLISQRGGDFVLECGQDLSIGYLDHDGDVVRLYLEESLTFHVATAEAAVALTA